MSALEGYIFWGYEDDHRTNSSSSSTGSITEAGDEQSDIDDDEFAHVNTEAEQGRVSRRNTGNYSANNGTRRTGSIDEAGQEPDGIGEGDAAEYVILLAFFHRSKLTKKAPMDLLERAQSS